VAASFVAQTHIPYLVLAGGIGLLATAVVVVRAVRTDDRRPLLVSLAWTAAVFAVLWVGPILDQWRRDPGNIRRLIDHFSSPTEETVGLRGGVELLLRHLDVLHAYGGLLLRTGSFVDASLDPAGPIWPGTIVLAVWLLAAVVSFRIDRRAAGGLSARSWLHVLVAATLVLSLASMARIFGRIWYYLTLWAWGTTTMLLVATLWTAITWWRMSDDRLTRPMVVATVAGTAVLVTAATSVAAIGAHHPEERLGETLGELVGPTEAALADGVGAATGTDGRYVVRWEDAAYFGSQGYGLVSELERDGFDAGVYDPWRVPATQHRVIPPDQATAEVILVTGRYVDVLRADDRVVEVASTDPRTPEQRVEFDELRRELIAEIRSRGLDDLVPLVDSNLFGVRIDLRLPDDVQELANRMLDLGVETAVFIGTPGGPP
jgi:hypothetical protein